MLIGYSIGMIAIAVLYICTISYKKNLRKKLNKKKYKLLRIYGMSMFLADRIPERVLNKNKEVNAAIKKLKVKENIKKEKYLYTVQKISIGIVIITISLLLGIVIQISEKFQSMEMLKELTRSDSKTTTYQFVAENENGTKENIDIEVNSKELTTEEIYAILKKKEKKLVKEVLGENESTEKVDRPLNLISEIGNNISVSWSISDNSVIDYEGNISESVSEDGSIVTLTATMMIKDVSLDYSFSVNVFPAQESKSIQEQVQNYVNENNLYDEKVELPTVINGQSVQYYYGIEETGKWFGLAGILGAIAIFFLKDKDMKSEVKKRNRQMLLDYPEIVSKILLYYNAGLSMKSTIERIVTEYKKEKQSNRKLYRYAYEELEMALIKMKSGVSELEALNEYGSRCGLNCYIKMTGIIEQNLKRGSREVSYALKTELKSAMIERKNTALKEGGEISTKLLGPMIIMLIISIVIIMVPAFLTIS